MYLSGPSDDRKGIAADFTRQSHRLAFLDNGQTSGRNRFDARWHYIILFQEIGNALKEIVLTQQSGTCVTVGERKKKYRECR